MNCGQAKSAAGPQKKLQARDSVSSDTVEFDEYEVSAGSVHWTYWGS